MPLSQTALREACFMRMFVWIVTPQRRVREKSHHKLLTPVFMWVNQQEVWQKELETTGKILRREKKIATSTNTTKSTMVVWVNHIST